MRGISVVFVLFSVAAVTLADKEDYQKFAKECIKEMEIKTDDKGFPDPKDSEEKCLAKCMGLKMKMIDENAKVIEENVPKKFRKVLKECDEKAKETDPCKRANELMHCAKPKRKNGKGKKEMEE